MRGELLLVAFMFQSALGISYLNDKVNIYYVGKDDFFE